MRTKLFLSLFLLAWLGACDAERPFQPVTDVHEAVEAKHVGINLGVPAETQADVIRFSDMEVVDGTRAGLLREDEEIRTRVHTAELSHGDVITLWWVIFNHPEACADGACGEADLFDGPNGPTGVEPSCLYADGSIVGGNGRARFHDRLPVEESRDSCIDFFVEAVEGLEGQDHGLTNPGGAEVHLVIRSHGPVIPGMLPDQRSSFAGGCQEFLGAGVDELEPGQCSDQQFAVFAAPDG